MPIYMKHPEHGTHIAYGDREAAECEKHGWVVFVPEWEKPAVAAPVVGEVIEHAPAKRRGPRPKVKNDGDSADAD